MFVIYIIMLDNNKYCVCKRYNEKLRLKDFYYNMTYKPIKILKIIKDLTNYKDYIKKYVVNSNYSSIEQDLFI